MVEKLGINLWLYLASPKKQHTYFFEAGMGQLHGAILEGLDLIQTLPRKDHTLSFPRVYLR